MLLKTLGKKILNTLFGENKQDQKQIKKKSTVKRNRWGFPTKYER
jgi:hypothetical protein